MITTSAWHEFHYSHDDHTSPVTSCTQASQNRDLSIPIAVPGFTKSPVFSTTLPVREIARQRLCVVACCLKSPSDTMLKNQKRTGNVVPIAASLSNKTSESPHAADFGPIWTSDEAAEYLRIHPRTLTRLAKRGEIPSIQIGRLWRFRRIDLDEWLTRKVNSVSYPCRLNS